LTTGDPTPTIGAQGALRMAVSHYRFYFKKDGHTMAAEVAECDGDDVALEQAKELLAKSTFSTMEVWQGNRKVDVIQKGAS
jgi:hypothetical protein